LRRNSADLDELVGLDSNASEVLNVAHKVWAGSGPTNYMSNWEKELERTTVELPRDVDEPWEHAVWQNERNFSQKRE
jgi:hypothetical protein